MDTQENKPSAGLEGILSQLIEAVNVLQREVAELRANQDTSQTEPQNISAPQRGAAILNSIKTRQAEEELRQNEMIQTKLDEATNFAIADFKKNPPKNRRG